MSLTSTSYCSAGTHALHFPGRHGPRVPSAVLYARGRKSAGVARAFKLTSLTTKETITIDKASATVGLADSANVRLSGPEAAREHALLESKAKQVFVRALVGDSLLDRTRTWVDGQELRPRVAYLLASGCELAFGTPDQKFTIEYDQPTGTNPMMEMLMQGMMSSASPETKKAMGS